MTTPLYPMFVKRINDATDRIIEQQITPWSFLNSGCLVQVKTYDGRQIFYQGIGFEGSPRAVFWSRYIEPFLESLTVQEIHTAVQYARERGVDARSLLPEVRALLVSASQKVFDRMAVTDQRLRAKGFPRDVPLRSIAHEIESITKFIDDHVRAELEMWKPRSRTEEWYEQKKFWVWVISSIIVVGIALLGFL